jgi:hypothetical protein
VGMPISFCCYSKFVFHLTIYSRNGIQNDYLVATGGGKANQPGIRKIGLPHFI